MTGGCSRVSLYAHALRVARPRQLRARALRPFRRRFLPKAAPPGTAAPIHAAASLWRSPAFDLVPSPDPSTRLGRFHANYGADVLEAARSGDAPTARDLIEHWIVSNPPRNDDAWHPYPLSTRVGNWIAACTLLPELSSARVSESLWWQLQRLTRNVEDDVLGNHLVRNARALVLGGAAFGDQALGRQGIDILRREIAEQILPDGGHYERSPSYHLVVLRDLLEVQATCPQVWLQEAIDRMGVFAAALQRPDGAPALFNDGTIDAPRLELPDPPEGLSIFPDSGFAVVRQGRLWLAFRCGRAAPDFLPPHAHADALSLQLWWDGTPVLVDPGSYTYEAGAERDWFRSTAAHSTISVDGRGQFETWGAFRSGPLAEVELHDARDGMLEASVNWPGGVRHIRRIEWEADAGSIAIDDTLEGVGPHLIESRLAWAQGYQRSELELIGVGDELRETGWVSERFGERSEITFSVVRQRAQLPARMGFRLHLS